MLHAGYLTCHSTPISDDGELEQDWFERLRRMKYILRNNELLYTPHKTSGQASKSESSQ
jgi:hypothetical protein